MDLSAIIRRAIEIGGDQRGFITFDEVNELMPSQMVQPKDIEALFEALREHGIDVREA
jgi:hypothetical protein